MLVDYLRAAACGIKLRMLPNMPQRHRFISSVMADFALGRISRAVDACIAYILRATSPRTLFARFDEALAFLQHLGSRSVLADQQRSAAEAVKVVAQQKDTLFLSIVRFWEDIGRMGYLRELARRGNEVPLGARIYLEHCLAGQELFTYCSVVFGDGGKAYHYLMGNADAAVGDTVLVPVGEENRMEHARVVAVEEYTYSAIPLPLERTKIVEKRVE